MFCKLFQKIIYSPLLQNHANALTKNDENDIILLPVGVYYEALCPDSRNFIHQHLVPSLNKAPNSFDIQFVPYGKAKVVNNYICFSITLYFNK